jgi:hypothetical protein
MANYTVRFVADTGQTLSAYPLQTTAGAAVSLASWSTLRAACTESGSTGNYGCTITDEYPVWAVLVAGVSAPSDFSSAIHYLSFADGGNTPVAANGELTTPIIIGDDYLDANNRAFTWTVDAVPGVTIGTATCFFGGYYKGYSWLVEGTITEVAGDWLLSFDLTKEDTADMIAGNYDWSVEVKAADGTEITSFHSLVAVEVVNKQT